MQERGALTMSRLFMAARRGERNMQTVMREREREVAVVAYATL
jgi:hypothetical protein